MTIRLSLRRRPFRLDTKGALRALTGKPVRLALVALAYLAGWALVSMGLASLLGPRVWYFAGGLLLFALGGLEPLGIIARYGLYKLSQTPASPKAREERRLNA